MFAHYIAGVPPDEFFWWGAGAIVIALAAFFFTFLFLRRTRLIEDMPTSRLRSAAQGYIEVEGVALLMQGPPILCPLTATRCVWWRYKVEERQSDSDNKKSWVTIDRGTSDDSFLLDDGTGTCVIDPTGADVIPTAKRTWYGSSPRPDVGYEFGKGILRSLFGRYRYTEELIFAANRVYSIGGFRTQSGGPSVFDEQLDVRELLNKWKHDKQMMAMLDVNKDGAVDQKEWEAARRMAIQKVRQQHIEESVNTPDLNILAKPRDSRPFILSGIPQAELIRRYRVYAAGCLGGTALSAGFFVWALHLRHVL